MCGRPLPPLCLPPGLCKLDLQLVSQNVESIWLSALYPVNSMRNRALANARTEAVLLLDVDFWPSAELSELMQKPAKYESLQRTLAGGAAVVLPAYETGDAGDVGVEVAREAVLGEWTLGVGSGMCVCVYLGGARRGRMLPNK
jgi:hypothetical protein